MTDFHSILDTSRHTIQHNRAPEAYVHPDEVLDDPRLSVQEKRAFLASWASDANAVPHIPSLRQLPGGSIVDVDDILRALKTLDASGDIPHLQRRHPLLWQRLRKRRRGLNLRTWSRYGRGPDDDDDPPPCPAYAAIRPKSGGGAALACPEPAFA